MNPDHAFYISPSSIVEGLFTLDKEESHHLSKVLRMNLGDEISLLDGVGTGYVGEIQTLGKRVSGKINKRIPSLGENPAQIHLAMGIIKRDRFELALEKATELGVQSITPLLLDRCIKRSINMDRSRKHVQSASKQCRRSYFPTIHEPTSLEKWLQSTKNETKIACLIGSNNSISALDLSGKHQTVHLVIGPEGDFSENEIKLLIKNDIIPATLGPRRLRTETAVISALAILNEILLD
jgi:16S rRNA (uracil1498-N3)-methyltransferase